MSGRPVSVLPDTVSKWRLICPDLNVYKSFDVHDYNSYDLFYFQCRFCIAYLKGFSAILRLRLAIMCWDENRLKNVWISLFDSKISSKVKDLDDKIIGPFILIERAVDLFTGKLILRVLLILLLYYFSVVVVCYFDVIVRYFDFCLQFSELGQNFIHNLDDIEVIKQELTKTAVELKTVQEKLK